MSFFSFTLLALYEQIKQLSFLYWMLALYEHILSRSPAFLVYEKYRRMSILFNL